MIFLEVGNRVIFETLQRAIRGNSQKRERLDVTCPDFDGVLFHISTPDANAKNIVLLSIQWRCLQDIMKNGGSEDLKRIYGPFVSQPESGYDVTLRLDLDNLPAEKEKLPAKFSLFKRHLFAAPFKRVFQSVVKGGGGNQIVQLNFHDDEMIWIKPEGDRVIVIFSVSFKDPDDQVFAKVFLQEFADARRNMSNAPTVTYTQRGEVPLELQGVQGVRAGANQGFVSFVLFQTHLAENNQIKTINNIQLFRDYLHYHIKCAKAYMHIRMRARVKSLLQVLNRARPEALVPKEKKLMSGRTFVRK